MDRKVKAERETLRLIKLLRNCENVTLSGITEKQYNFEFEVRGVSDKVKIQVYFGKKGVKTVLQGNRESEFYRKINEFISGESSLFGNEQTFSVPSEYIGSDESGKGDFFGPLAVAAFYTNEKITKILFDLGVRDSKTLSEKQIGEISDFLKKEMSGYFSVFVMEPKNYNKLYVEYGNNLNKLMVYAHSEAVKPLLRKFGARYVITDKFSNRALTLENDNEFRSVKFVQETKAEKYPAVAAASIIARSEVNKWFNARNKELERFGIVLPKGASAEADKAAERYAELFSEEKLYDVCKTHFKNFLKIR